MYDQGEGSPAVARIGFPLTLASCLVMAYASMADAAPREDCREHWICVRSQAAEDDVEIIADNLSPVPLTLTLKVKTRYFEPDSASSLTETVGPRQSRRLMTLVRGDDRQNADYRFSYKWTVGNKDAVHDENHLYRLPYADGRSYRVLQGFGSRFSHTGVEQYAVDFKMKEGTPVHAARAGVVAKTEEANSIGCWESGCGDHANYIIILHDDDTTGEYYHLKKDGVLVDVGERVTAGQEIGLSGNTGHSTMPHLHFGVYRAIASGREQSLPVRFASADGIVNRPRRGGRYQAIAAPQQARNIDLADSEEGPTIN